MFKFVHILANIISVSSKNFFYLNIFIILILIIRSNNFIIRSIILLSSGASTRAPVGPATALNTSRTQILSSRSDVNLSLHLNQANLQSS